MTTKNFCETCGQSVNKKTFVHFILDKSSSMESVKAATISGFNEYLNTLRKDGQEYRVSLTLFNEHVERHSDIDLSAMQELSESSYQPSGMTALYDAVCETLRGTPEDGDKHIVVIMTDGEENSSRRHSERDLRENIKRLTNSGRWTFVYLGANQDAWANAQRYGLSMGNTALYNSTDIGTRAAFVGMAMSTSNLAASADASTTKFFSKEDQDKIQAAK